MGEAANAVLGGVFCGSCGVFINDEDGDECYTYASPEPMTFPFN